MSNEIEECSICKQRLISNVVTLSCGHTYHRECILMWSNIKLDCPLCRRNFTNRNKNVLGIRSIRTTQPRQIRNQPLLTLRQVNNIIGNFRPISPQTMGFVPMSRPTIPSEFNLTSNYQPPINIRSQEALNGFYIPTPPPTQSPSPQPINMPRRSPQQTETPYRRLFTIQPTSNLTTSTEQSNIRRSRRRNRSSRGNRNVNRNTRNTTRRRLGGSNRKKYRKKNNKSKKLK